MRRWAIAILCLGGIMLFAAPCAAVADDYPTRPIHLIITTPAGSLIDVLGRLLAEGLGQRLGQPAVVDNRPGGMTQLGTDVLVHADPDGYTLMIGPSELTMLPFLKKDYPYDATKDVVPVALVTTSWTVFAIYPGLPVQTLPQFVDYAKANRDGVDGLASARVAEGGKLRILAQTGPNRHPLYPDVPTTAEYGLPDVRMDTWFGLVAPPKTPDAIVARLDRAVADVEQQQSFRDGLARIGCADAYLPHDKFAAYIAADLKKWQSLIPAMGIPPIE
jgi:tripartite-type tricarboxylate transporter receptor subunit TctC